ncbi:hypothetical protein SEPCBS119000_000929 [Sporothrix epigloea]|uniref:Xylanolytic transcriptional activator regulatory domain-containing protein n=1 Tax=Sporothrix epigloea TaxID=1892477 RepID=A0ABP0D7Y7_9PEZI
MARMEDLLALLVERTEDLNRSAALTLRPTCGSQQDDNNAQRQEVQQQYQQQVPFALQADRPAASTWEILLNDGQEEGALPFTLPSSTDGTPQSGTKRNTHDKSAAWKPALSPRDTLPANTGTLQNGMHEISHVLALYPSTQLALQLWTVYVKAVDPVLKILHIPTLQYTVVATILNPASAGPSTLALTLAIYYAALTAEPTIMAPEEARAQLARCKTALDSLLTVTNLVERPDMPFLQALAIYVTCLRVHNASRSVWVLNGLAIRLAQSMGLHRNEAYSQLSPFESEMRLCLWWHLCVLDSRAPEDQGLQPHGIVAEGGLRQPLNVNDAQLYPDMTQLPLEMTGKWTDMSFFLVQTEGCRRMHPILEIQAPDSMGAAEPDAQHSNGDQRKLFRDPDRYMQARFGVSMDGQEMLPDLARMAIQHVNTAVKKMEFVLQLRKEISLQRSTEPGRTRFSDKQRESALLRPSFRLACAALQSSRALQQASAATPFAWLFRTYIQWYALAYVLRCLCCHPRESVAEIHRLSEEAWDLVDALLPRIPQPQGRDDESNDSGSIWNYLHKLRQQAALLRDDQARMIAANAGQTQAINTMLAEQPPGRLAEKPVADQTTTTADADLFAESGSGQDWNMANAGQASPDGLSSLDLFMADIPFLTDWDAFISI